MPVLFSLLVTLGIGIGIGIGEAIGDSKYSSTPIIPLSAVESASDVPLMQKTFPTTILIRIKPVAEIAAADKEAYAIAFPYRQPCEIWIPEGQKIIFYPKRGSNWNSARWDDSEVGDALAHELLHCLRGRWHDIGDGK